MDLPSDNSIQTQITDGVNLVSQVNDNTQILQSVVSSVPQVQTVLTDNVANISSVINAPFVEVTSVNGMTGDVITEPIMQNYQNNHYYPQNTIVNYNGNIYWAKSTFTSGGSFDSTKWNKVSATAYRDLTGQLQKSAYRRSVIALCEVSMTNNTEKNSYSSGKIAFHRSNGLAGLAEINVNMENQYSGAYYSNFSYYGNVNFLAPDADIDTKTGFRPCTFKYNDVWYGGIELYIAAAQLYYVTFEGVGNFNVFGLDYYKVPYVSGGTSYPAEIINQEVYDSLNYSQYSWQKAVIGARALNTDTGEIKKNNTYTATLPNKNGTIAMTSDITTVNNATLTIQKNGSSVGTFTANASSNSTVNITVPTKTSELTNNSNFVVSTSLASVATSGSYSDLSNRPISAGTTDIGEGASLTTGDLYCVYDA